MAKDIIVAGAGLGGLAAAALLAKRGYNVKVYEKSLEEDIGENWADTFSANSFKSAGILKPLPKDLTYKKSITFYSTSLETPLNKKAAANDVEIKMERKELSQFLINNARSSGVEFVFGCNIIAPILTGNRVVGIDTEKGRFFADLIVDAAGMNSVLRTNLPKICGIENEISKDEQMYIYRASFNDLNEDKDEDMEDIYNIYLFPEEKAGISWVSSETKGLDVFIGRFSPFEMSEVQRHIEYLREINPNLGLELLREGGFSQVPVRQPLSVMVCDGYVAIGDSAFMNVPLIGSGIANSLKAARLLVNTIISDTEGEFSADKLWPYQLDFYRHIGEGLAILACVKKLLLKITPEELDYLFQKGILTANEMTISASSINLSSFVKIPPMDLIGRIKKVSDDKALIKKIIPPLFAIGRLKTLTATMPKKWSKQRVILWSKRYLDVFNLDWHSFLL